MDFLIMFLITAVLSVVTYLLTPSPDMGDPAAENDISIPENSNGKPIPRLYGYARLSGNCIWYGGRTTTPIRG